MIHIGYIWVCLRSSLSPYPNSFLLWSCPVACSLLTAQAVQCQPYGLPDTGLAPLPLCFSDTDPAGEGLAPTAVQTAGAHQNSPGRRGPVSAVSHAGSCVTRPHLTNTSVQPVLSHTEQNRYYTGNFSIPSLNTRPRGQSLSYPFPQPEEYEASV